MTHALRIAAASIALTAGLACSKDRPRECTEFATARSATSYAACGVVAVNTVTQDEARALGFPVDDDLARLAQPIDVPFHRGDYACGTPAPTTGQLRITVAVDAIEHNVNRPTTSLIDPSMCPDFLAYAGTIDLRTDEGTLSGSTRNKIIAGADSSGAHAMAFGFGASAAAFSGTLGIVGDWQRQSVGVVRLSGVIRDAAVSGQLFTSVIYCDGDSTWESVEGDYGDGLFWPPDNPDNPCRWIGPTPPGYTMTLDAFNAR
jgi:hypothetical protein